MIWLYNTVQRRRNRILMDWSHVSHVTGSRERSVAKYMSQATPGYRFIHHVPPIPDCLSTIRNWSNPSFSLNWHPMAIPLWPAPTMSTG